MKQIDFKKTYDAIVVGSGAAGGMAAKELAEKGLEVLMLEAGPYFKIEDFNHHRPVWDFPFRGSFSPRERAQYCYAANPWNKQSFIDETKNPYTKAEGTNFVWVRARAVGGKTLHWGLVSLRFSPDDFHRAGLDGYGIDWPITYEEIEPYYRHVESVVGICGTYESLPNNPDSLFLPPVPMTCGEKLLRKGVEKFPGRRLIHGRSATATVPHGDRPACHFCGHCDRVCDSRSSFSSLGVLIPLAEQTGRFTLRPNAVVREVLLTKKGDTVSGVSFLDRETRREFQVRGRVVILGASSLESTRLLLNSTSRRYPNGLGNSSGALGKYFCEHIMGGSINGIIPSLKGTPPVSGDARPYGSSPYLPKFRNVTEQRKDFLRGYGFETEAGSGEFPGYARSIKGFGADFKARVREMYNTTVGMTAFGEVLPRADNFVEIDKTRTDEWGIPVLKFHVTWGENEKAMVKDMNDTAEEMFRAAGIEIVRQSMEPRSPGFSIHEAGTCRMGSDPKVSMLNSHNQSHEIANLFVVDGSSFTSSTEKNPTLTIMALAARAADFITEEMRRGKFRSQGSA